MAGETFFITLNRDALKRMIRQAVWNAIASKVGAVNHTNHDAYFAPSEWWYDKDFSVRHHMTTSGNMHFGGGTLTVYLSYNVT